MQRQKLIVVSFDAMIREDLDKLRAYPTFRRILENGARVEHLHSIYPTLTYPCHTTMATGCYPDKTGVINNEQQLPGVEKLPWLWEHEAVCCEDILTAAHKAGYSTAAVGWPVTGHHPDVDYLVDEAWPHGVPGTAENFRQAYLDTGTPVWLFDKVVAPYLEMRLGRKQPDSSFFLTHISCDIIRNYQPDVLLLHVGNLDAYRHKNGVFAPRVEEGLPECEKMLSMLMQATADAGVAEQTNFVITSDHGQIDVNRTVHPNVLFRRQGWIQVTETGEVSAWRVWCYPAGGSAQIVLRAPDDTAFYEEVYAFLKRCCQEGDKGFSRVLTRDEARAERLDGNFSFVLETDNRSQFAVAWNGEMTVPAPQGRMGTHGHHPDKGVYPVWIGFGPAFRRGAVLAGAKLVDGAPTYAAILGAALPQADGRILTELLV